MKENVVKREVAKQIIFDCAMEIMYHTENLSNELIASKILDALHSLDVYDGGDDTEEIRDSQ